MSLIGAPHYPAQEADPSGKRVSDPGSKLDAGKAPLLRGLLQYFPRAMKAVSEVSLAGHLKGYPWKGWEAVEEGIQRYGDALARHLIAEEIEGEYDADIKARTGLDVLHAAQVAWNAFARLELILREKERNAQSSAK